MSYIGCQLAQTCSPGKRIARLQATKTICSSLEVGREHNVHMFGSLMQHLRRHLQPMNKGIGDIFPIIMDIKFSA